MRHICFVVFVICVLLAGIPAGVAAADSSAVPVRWDDFSDTWVATDALGRVVPGLREVGPTRVNKFIGVFYFLWLGQHGDAGPFDISKILAAEPGAIDQPQNPTWGPLGVPHHWGESLFGYYVSDDESVLRKHAQMLGDAGVDVIIFDVTNQLTYPKSWRALCRVFAEMRAAGNRVPQIAFLCPFGEPRKVFQELWEQLYGQNLYPELWFRWEGKPLILANAAKLDKADARSLEFFTFRKPQPDYFMGPRGPNEWGWLEVTPQHVFTNRNGAAEETTVGVGQNAVEGKLGVLSNPKSRGRSFHDGREPSPEACDFTGRNFSEQWHHALAVDPSFIFITGWNEWIAGRFDAHAPFHGSGPVTFVDEFNEEFSRDIEPMKGGHGDSYYYQMISEIRRFKGVRSLSKVRSQPITIDGSFEDWGNVTPEFRDTVGDPVHRDHPGWGKGTRYRNSTGRNDIIAAKVSMDTTNVYFYVRTREALSPCSGSNWMLLFIDADQNSTNGWLGYDFVVNRDGVKKGTTKLGRHEGKGGYSWGDGVAIAWSAKGNEMELALPRSALGDTKFSERIDFKWADNIQQTGDWSDFTLNGDAAPNDRFNYRAVFDGR
jgi:hypothetical protein